MSTRLPQLIPFFRHINVQLGFRPECLDGDATADTCQADFISLMVRVDAAATGKAFNIASVKTGFRSPFSMNLSPSSSLEIIICLVCFMQIAVFWKWEEGSCSGRYLPALKTCCFEATRSDAAPNQFLGAAISGCAREQSRDRSLEKGVRHFWPS